MLRTTLHESAKGILAIEWRGLNDREDQWHKFLNIIEMLTRLRPPLMELHGWASVTYLLPTDPVEAYRDRLVEEWPVALSSEISVTISLFELLDRWNEASVEHRPRVNQAELEVVPAIYLPEGVEHVMVEEWYAGELEEIGELQLCSFEDASTPQGWRARRILNLPGIPPNQSPLRLSFQHLLGPGWGDMIQLSIDGRCDIWSLLAEDGSPAESYKQMNHERLRHVLTALSEATQGVVLPPCGT
jgi:hypothetical protein